MRIAKEVNKVIFGIPVWLIYLTGFVPTSILFHGAYYDRLGPDPLKVIEHELGEYALIFLIVVLSFHPLKKFLGINLIRLRRSFGLLAFWYATLHLLTYLVLDQQLMLDHIIRDLTKRPYIIVGALAFLILIPLALTSNSWSVRRLGLNTWRSVHAFVYLAAFLAAMHYLMLVKSWPLEPLIYMLVIILLIGVRWISKKVFNSN